MTGEHEQCLNLLKVCYRDAENDNISTNMNGTKDHLDVILSNSEKSKGVLAVVVTSLVKKTIEPKQDIRQHQSSLDGGYSGRTLDVKTVTPFLKTQHFPAMSESGWLTRSLEQNQAYTLDYRGRITPNNLKDAFLHTLDIVEKNSELSKSMLTYLFCGLIKQRDENHNLVLAKPINLPIRTIVEYLGKHFTYTSSGSSRLPVLAIYAAYQQMIKELSRYKNCKLKPLESHTSADRRSGVIGDIEIIEGESKIFEAVEVKHEIEITPDLIRESCSKFKSEPVKRYYLLTTSNKNQNNEEITNEVIKISRAHGCQVIVNGVMDTLKYYLRLLKNPDEFIQNYVELLERDDAIKFDHKQKWDEIIQENGKD